ncbi:MAG: acyl-CoA dehydrogenase family protein [Actinobacteria bacterium]|nr:acyl-CoA dehydrogenase family protein [Actinomycetota bacterium]
MTVLESQQVSTNPDRQRVEEACDRLLTECPPQSCSERQFLEAQFDAGLAWVHFPLGNGGLGVSPGLQREVISALSAQGAPIGGMKNPIGYGMCAPAVEVHGTDQQKEMLRSLFSNEHIWCQMFSEPGAGSDVASLAMRAERDGDEWVLNGQKVWTTLAHISAYGLVIARTDPELPKHRGITAFIVDMHAPGVEVRPLRQMTGEAEFNEVYLTDVRIPDSMRLDDVGRGWAVSITTLMNERVSIGGGTPPRGSGPIGQLLQTWQTHGTGDAVQRDLVTKLWIDAEVNRLTNIRASQLRKAGTPGPEGSVAKLAMAENNKAIYSLALDIMGAQGMLYESYEFGRPRHALFSDDMYKNFLRARANSIEGGTSEVLKNIIGERVLGLSGDVRVDKVAAWKDVPRN